MSNPWRVVLGLLVALPRLAAGQPPKPHDAAASAPARDGDADEMLYSCGVHSGPVAVTLKPETEVKDLITWAMGFTCKSFILDPRIVATGKKVTLIAPNKMSPAEAYQMFLVALSTVGLTVVKKGNLLRVVDAAAARREVLPIYKQVPGDSEQLVRVVIRPSYAQPEALRQALQSIKSDAGDIAVVGSMLVVTDFASTLTSMMSLKKLVDVPAGTEGTYTIPIRHGDAAKMAQLLTAMFSASPGTAAVAPPPGGPGGPGGAAGKPGGESAGEPAPSKILVEERTNTLVLSATEPAYERARALIERLDVGLELESGSSIHPYQLSSAIAEELAATLTKAISGDGPAARPQRGGADAGTSAPQPQVPGQTRPQPAAPSPLDSLSAALQGAVHVIADKSTNKLLISSSAHDFLALRDVIRELDQPRRQVYIEAMILEVDVTNGLTFGASAHSAAGAGDSSIGFGGVQLPELSSLNPASALKAGGLIGGLFGAPLTGLGSVFGSSALPTGTSVPSYGLLIQAFAGHSNTNILSTPSIVALDNEEAKSKIGENIPYLGATVPAATGSTTSVTSVARQALELELDIKPHISADDTVLLEIKHSNGGVKDLTGALGPTWTTRSMETRVVVRDQQTVVIGGLMQDTVLDTESKVPILGDVPLLGYLFKYTSKTKHKSNLVIMLTPYIIKDQLDLERIRQRKLRQNDEFFGSMARLDSVAFAPGQDYGRKRGLIEEINRSVLEVETEHAMRAAATAPAGVPTGRVEVPEPAAP